MDRPLEWHFWSAEQIVGALSDLVATAESRLEEFPEEHREKNQAAVQSLRDAPPTALEIRDGSRSRELVTLGFALDVLGRRTAAADRVDESLRLFQAAHEMFRGGNPLLRATQPMRQTVSNALRALVGYEVTRCQAGETTAAAIREEVEALVRSAWGLVPPQLLLGVNELLMNELERIRAAGEADPAFHERIIRDNIEAVLPELDKMIGGGLITLERAKVIMYRPDIPAPQRRPSTTMDITGSWEVKPKDDS